MARTNDSTKTNKGSIKAAKEAGCSLTTFSNDQALAKHRVERFMADETTPATALALQPDHYITAETVELAAKERMAAKLLAFDNAF